MERRNFFGICGGLLGALGLKSSNKEEPVTDLPIINFDDKWQITNVDEIFKISETWTTPYGCEKDYAEAYLREEDACSVPGMNMSVYYGPILVCRYYYFTADNKKHSAFSFARSERTLVHRNVSRVCYFTSNLCSNFEDFAKSHFVNCPVFLLKKNGVTLEEMKSKLIY